MITKKYHIVAFTLDKSKTKYGNGFIKHHNVSKVNNYLNYLDREFPKWRYATLYDALTGLKVCVLTPNKRIPP